jgi:hypothetical protein
MKFGIEFIIPKYQNELRIDILNVAGNVGIANRMKAGRNEWEPIVELAKSTKINGEFRNDVCIWYILICMCAHAHAQTDTHARCLT